VPDVFFVDGDETRKEEIAEISITFRGEAVIAKVHSCIGAPLLYDDLLADIQETFHDLHFTRGIQYPMLPTLCVVRRVRARTSGGTSEPATAPDVESDVVIVEIVDACAVIWAPSHNFNMWHELIVKMHTSSPPRQDAMRTSLVTSGRPSVHYRLEVDCFSRNILECHKGPNAAATGQLCVEEHAMSPLEAMHPILAQDPRAQAKFCLPMIKLSYCFCLGMERFKEGRLSLGRDENHGGEHEAAATLQPALLPGAGANFAPNESQGRGSVHSHGKTHGGTGGGMDRGLDLLMFRGDPPTLTGRRVRWQGKALVRERCICTDEGSAQYCRVMVEREHPFRSSSNDVLQVTARCNVDFQYGDASGRSRVPCAPRWQRMQSCVASQRSPLR